MLARRENATTQLVAANAKKKEEEQNTSLLRIAFAYTERTASCVDAVEREKEDPFWRDILLVEPPGVNLMANCRFNEAFNLLIRLQI